MALTLNLVVPALAGLVAGTGAVATFVTGSTSPAPASIERPCAAQTWPYIAGKCIVNADRKQVRVVMAPRANETDATTSDKAAVPSAPPQASGAGPAAGSRLTSRDTVLRQPDVAAPLPKISKPRAKRSERRRQWSARSYQVPESRSGQPRAMIVVRPLRLEAYR